MRVSELMAILRPTGECVQRPSVPELEQAEHAIGSRLPADYKEFIQTYGSGYIAGFMVVFSPIANKEWMNITYLATHDNEGWVQSRRSHPVHFPYNRYRETGGLMPWGATDNGDQLYWLTDGEPDGWPVIASDIRSAEHVRFDMNMVDFLGGLVQGSIRVRFFPDDVDFAGGRFAVPDDKLW